MRGPWEGYRPKQEMSKMSIVILVKPGTCLYYLSHGPMPVQPLYNHLSYFSMRYGFWVGLWIFEVEIILCVASS